MRLSEKNIFKYQYLPALTWLLISILCSCRNDLYELPNPDTISGDEFIISGSILLPDMVMTETRGAMGDKPGENLNLTILEFDKGSTYNQSFISRIYHAEVTSATNVENGGIVNFNVTLNATEDPKVLHLIVTGNYITTGDGNVATILPRMTVNSNQEAYWGRCVFDNGFTETKNGTTTLLAEVKTFLTKVPMIRNFAKITVENRAANFQLSGFDVVNVPTSGTIAPWNTTLQEIPELLSANGTGGFSMKSYEDITNPTPASDPSEGDEEDTPASIPGLPYSGILPANVGFRNQEATARTWVDGENSNMRSTLARYIYEHPYEPTRRTYIIVNGIYTDESNTKTQGFYKIDIGKIKTTGDDAGTFEYYNIIRNINYNIVIQNVMAPGSTTVGGAIDRAPFNNLLAATETSTMLNVSDGNNMLIVNDLNHVIINADQEVKILYRYLTDITSDKTVSNDSEGLGYIVGEGDVIMKNASDEYEISQENITDKSGTEWVQLTVKTNAPDPYQTKEQTITIVDGHGLGRTITLILRKPWTYQKIGNFTATIARGAYNLYGSEIPQTPQQVSNQANENFTVYFNLPDGIPESVFPLDFTLEAKYQGVENNKIGTMLVTYGSSFFDPDVTAIQYIKTVTLNEYKYQYNGADDSSGFDIGKPNTNHTIRCRFSTISTVDNNSEGIIRVYNEYFVNPDITVDDPADPYKSKCAEVTFKRVTSPL